MEERTIENNRVTVSGEILSGFTFSHEMYGEKFYVFDLMVKRKSGTEDDLPVVISERLVDVKAEWQGQYAQITGQFRSYNKHTENGSKLVLSVFAREFSTAGFNDEEPGARYDKNQIFLDGYICKQPNYRKTPLGREITGVILAVNRPYGKSDYIPCICWGRNARFAGNLEVGTHIIIEGRIQSREYIKKISEAEIETRIAYEVSTEVIGVLDETEVRDEEKRDESNDTATTV